MASMIFKIKVVLPEAGKLASAISKKDIERVTHLVVEGKINAEDFEVMHRDMRSLSHLNLKNCDIEAIDGLGADKIPDMAFTHYIGHDEDGYEKYIGKRTLKKVILPESATVIGKRALRSVKKLQRIELPKSLFCICDEAFQECKRLDCDLEFAPSLKSIGNDAFLGCYSLGCELIFPDGLANIGNGAFQYCTKISNIILPKNSCKIGVAAFSGCEKVYTHLVIPQGCEKIEALAFNECQAIKSIEIPATCREIGDHAFGEPLFLEKVIIHATTPPKLGKKSFLHQGIQADLYVPEGCYEEYAASDWSKQFHYITEHIIAEGNIDYRDLAYIRDNCPNLEELDLREATIVGYKHHEANTIPENALCVTCYDLFFELHGMGKLKRVILPKGVTTIHKYAFGDSVEVIAAEDYCPF